MAVGTSGRIVIEVEPELKQQLYAVLERDGMTLKEWFVSNAQRHLADSIQLALEFTESKAQIGGRR